VVAGAINDMLGAIDRHTAEVTELRAREVSERERQARERDAQREEMLRQVEAESEQIIGGVAHQLGDAVRGVDAVRASVQDINTGAVAAWSPT
jgi:methyl-accepting chemotaxis protein